MAVIDPQRADPSPPRVEPDPPAAQFSAWPAPPPPLTLTLTQLPAQPCPYLPGRPSTNRALYADCIPGDLYHRFMDAGFRRSGKVIYQPVCQGCRACLSLRVPVRTFRPDKSQRRCRRRNADLHVTAGDPSVTEEKYDLYVRYLAGWHGRTADADGREGFESFLYESPVQTVEFCYRDGSGRLLAVGLCDVCEQSLSSVYFYFDPAESRRGLGTFGALYEIEAAARLNIPYYYLGYWVDGCGSMQYKSSYRPFEVLHPDGVWRKEGPTSPPALAGERTAVDENTRGEMARRPSPA